MKVVFRWRRKYLASVFILGASHVFGQSSVTIYGRIDTSVEYSNFGPSHTVHMGSSDLAPTAWGLTGTEELGRGYRAIFKLENGFNSFNGAIAQPGSPLFGRQAWVGIQGPIGTFQIGSNQTPLHTVLLTYSMPGLAWGNAANNFIFGPIVRANNSVRYVSPVIDGLTLRALVARGNNGTSTTSPSSLGDVYSAGLNYSYQNLSADFLYEVQRFSPVPAAELSSTSPVQAGNYLVAGVSYNFGYFKQAILYVHHGGGSDVAQSVAPTYATPKSDIFEVDATVPVGVASLLLSYGHYRDVANSNGNADSYAIRFDYPLSKATVLYTGFEEVKNGIAANFILNTSQGPGTIAALPPGHNDNSLVFGMLHRF